MEGENIKIEVTQSTKQAVKTVSKTVGAAKVQATNKHNVGSAPIVTIKNAAQSKNLVTIIALDADGNEKGNEFNVTEKEYLRSFSNESKFKFKKKAK